MLSTILSVLLFVLKIIGFILLFLLALLLIVLLVPIRYHFDGSAYVDKPITGNVHVTWFLHLIHVRVNYLSKKLTYELKIFGKVFVSNAPEFLKRKEERALKKAEKIRKKKEKSEKNQKESSSDDNISESIVEEVKVEVSDSDEVASAKENVSIDEKEMEEKIPEGDSKSDLMEHKDPVPYNPTRQPTVFPEENQKKKGQKEKPKKKESRKDSKTGKKVKKDKEKKEDKKSISQKIEEVKAMMEEYQVMALLGILKVTLIRILKHVLPRKLEGYLHFGFDDPGLTGRATGYAAIFYPLYHKTLTLEPDFQEKVLEGELKGHGRIRLAFFIWILITLLLKKEIRNLIRIVLKKK